MSRKKKGKGNRHGHVADPIERFFNQYPRFRYRQDEGIVAEFDRMCDYFDWTDDDYAKQRARRKFNEAMVEQFNNIYGTDVDDIDCWHRLFVALDVEPLPPTIQACKKKIKKIHVNLVDLVDGYNGHQIRKFKSVWKLRQYTIETDKIFPKNTAKAGGVLKFLLRQIL